MNSIDIRKATSERIAAVVKQIFEDVIASTLSKEFGVNTKWGRVEIDSQSRNSIRFVAQFEALAYNAAEMIVQGFLSKHNMNTAFSKINKTMRERFVTDYDVERAVRDVLDEKARELAQKHFEEIKVLVDKKLAETEKT